MYRVIWPWALQQFSCLTIPLSNETGFCCWLGWDRLRRGRAGGWGCGFRWHWFTPHSSNISTCLKATRLSGLSRSRRDFIVLESWQPFRLLSGLQNNTLAVFPPLNWSASDSPMRRLSSDYILLRFSWCLSQIEVVPRRCQTAGSTPLPASTHCWYSNGWGC